MATEKRERRELKVGPVEVLFDGGDLRYFRVGGVEVLRRIYVAVRNEEWGTVPATIEGLKVESSGAGFSGGFRARHSRGGIGFEWDGKFAGRSAGSGRSADVTVRYEMSGRTISTYKTNRTGVCVLHPIIGCAGRGCRVEHTDGRVEETKFPELISPDQPFFNVKAMSHEPVERLQVEVRFEGEVFETEDQRNWTDGSYKTYCRPLALPFPYTLSAGEGVRHVVTVRVTGSLPEVRGGNEIRVGERIRAMPEVRVVAAGGSAGGGAGYFADVNRDRPSAGEVVYPIHPQVHSTDDLSVMENLQGQGDTVRTTRAFAPGARIRVGPVTLHATPAEGPDPRELSQFGAAWVVGSIRELAEAGADVLEYGIFDSARGSEMARVIREITETRGGEVLACESSDGLGFVGLAVREKGRVRVWVANLREGAVKLTVSGLPRGAREVALGAYEVVRLDS